MVKEPSYSTMDIDNLDVYYEDCVIGGPGSFVVTIKERDKFKEAIRTKLLLEVAGTNPGAPGGAGRVTGPGAARQLPDRREDLAGPLGAVGLADAKARRELAVSARIRMHLLAIFFDAEFEEFGILLLDRGQKIDDCRLDLRAQLGCQSFERLR